MRDTAAMLLFGVFLGTLLALLAGRTAGAMLFGLKTCDLATLVFAFVLLASPAASVKISSLLHCTIDALLPTLRTSDALPVNVGNLAG
jgi:hypothetical protein